MLGGVHLRMENFQESWLMSQQAGVSGLCEKFHLYRLEKLVAISKFLDSYCSRIMGGGQDNPAGICCPPGVKITRVGGRISRDRLPPRGNLSMVGLPSGGQPVQGAR